MNQTSIERLYPLLIIGAGALIRLLKKKAKEQKEERAREASLFPPPPPVIIREVAPPKPVTKPPLPIQEEVSVPLPKEKNKKPRISKLISGLKHKQDLVLFSEILVNKHQVK